MAEAEVSISRGRQAPINIECFMEDIDVKGMMDRAEMLSVAEPLLVKLDAIMAEALTASGLTQADLASVEIFGGTCRIPAVQDRIQKFFEKPVSKTLNFDECVAKGCALQCAMLSPAFKVRRPASPTRDPPETHPRSARDPPEIARAQRRDRISLPRMAGARLFGQRRDALSDRALVELVGRGRGGDGGRRGERRGGGQAERLEHRRLLPI